MARQGVDLKGVVSFHGNLVAVQPALPGMIKAKILVLAGDADKFVPPAQVAAFRQEMETAKAAFRIISYPGAMHSFTNPDADKYAKEFHLPLGYNAEADKNSWEEMKRFLADIFEMRVNTSTLYGPSAPASYNYRSQEFNPESGHMSGY